MKKIIEKGHGFIWINIIKTEISWWKNSVKGFYIYPSLALCRTGNTIGFKILFMKYTIDFSYFFRLKSIKDK